MGNSLAKIDISEEAKMLTLSDPTMETVSFTFFGLTEKEQMALHDMLLHYKEFTEEVHDAPAGYDPTTLFTTTQLELFRVFGVTEQEGESDQDEAVSAVGSTH